MVTQRIFNTRLLIYLLIYLHLTAGHTPFSRVAGILYERQWQNHVVGL